jgi:hypothetical protein
MMEIVCPSCGKANEMSPCRRCGCDLSSLFAIDAAAGIELVAAGRCLRTANASDARKHATRSWQLRHAPGAARLAFIACVVLGDFAGARIWRQRAVGQPKA